jgi:hypothetical protein
MARSALLFLVGIIAGGAVVWLAAGSRTETPAVPVRTNSITVVDYNTDSSAAAAASADVSAVVDRGGQELARRIAVYERAAATSDAFELEAAIDLALRQPVSNARNLEIAVLLARLSELDARAAVEFARSRYVDVELLEPVYAAWARVDADAAIASVGAIGSPSLRRRLALAVLGVIGYAPEGIARVAAVLPELEGAIFEYDAITAQAKTDPFGALTAVLRMPETSMRQTVLLEIAAAAARLDPGTAIARADAIANPSIRGAFRNRVFSEWAKSDPLAVFALIESPDFDYRDEATGSFATLAAADSERLLADAEDFPSAVRAAAQRAVILAIAESDPLAAIAQTGELMPPGQERDSTIGSIAETYGRDDPEQALLWVKSLSPPSQDALIAVLRGIMQVDFDRAIDVIVEEAENAGARGGLTSQFSFSIMFLTLPTPGDADYVRLAERLADAGQSNVVRSMFRNVLSRWSSQDSEAALNWAIANADRIDGSAFSSLASRTASSDPELAMQTLASLPTNQRQGWIAGVAQGLAQTDLDRAIAFINQYRGQPAFDDAVLNLVSLTARSDPARAAELIGNAGSSASLRTAASMLGSQWAQTDPRAAAAWAQGLDNRAIQSMTLRSIASSWVATDAGAARSWLLGMGNGEIRDSALDGFMSAAAAFGDIDEQLLQAYSSDTARQRGASMLIAQVGRTDVDEARRLLDVYISDDRIRQQTESMLAQVSGVGNGGAIILNGGIQFTN